MPEKLKEENVIQYFNEYGYKLLDNYTNCPARMKIEDEEGYLYYSSYNAFNSGISRYGGTGGLLKFGRNNPFTLKNIENWLSLNNKEFSLVENQIFERCDSKLFFKCKKCPTDNNIFSTTWNSVYSNGVRHCPYCSGHEIGKYNNLSAKFPDLGKQWDHEKNFPLKPEDVIPGSKRKVFWICENNHSFKATLYARAYLKSGCPYCSGLIASEKNNLYFLYPDLIDDCWDWELNNKLGLNPNNLLSLIQQKAWWICPNCEERSFIRISDRVLRKSICKFCNISIGEDAVKNYLDKKGIKYIYQKSFDGCKDKLPLHFDFYLSDYNLAIEVNGIQHYKSVKHFGGEERLADRIKKDKIKKDFCNTNGIKFMEIPYLNFKNIEKNLEKALASFKGKEV